MKEHLEKIKSPDTVFLSEDGSGVVRKVVYDVKTNQLIGLVLPLNAENGIPKAFSYIATTHDTINQLMELPKSSLVYLVVAQPLKKNAPLFILQIFGMPDLYASQPCEFIFRHMRSMGTNNFTKINFSLFELFHLIKRVELANDITLSRLGKENCIFPRIKKVYEDSRPINCQLPSDQEIIAEMLKAQNDALENAFEFGIRMSSSDIDKCELKAPSRIVKPKKSSITIPCSDESDIDIQSAFVEIENGDGTTKRLRKSTLLWLLTESKGKLSADRLQRVQDMSAVDSSKKRRLMPGSSRQDDEIPDEMLLIKSSELQIGDWCFFKYNEAVQLTDLESDSDVMEHCILGNILNFKYITKTDEHQNKINSEQKRKKRKRTYLLDFAPLSAEVAALATWYKVNHDGFLHPVKSDEHFFIDIKQYLGTLKNAFVGEQCSSNNLRLKYQDLGSINSSLAKHLIEIIS